MFDVSLLATIGFIFLATLLGSYLRSRRKDPCLASFEDFHVTVERSDGKIIWGVMELESTGMELRYRDDVQDEKHIESSYILYGNEYGDIQAIFRYADDLSPENRAKRDRDIHRSFHPGLGRRLQRGVRKFLGTATDSLNDVVSLLVGRAKKPAGRYITDTGEAYLKSMGSTLIGSVGGVFDPLLERYIGQKVVIEVMEGDEVHEHVGIFKNYSPDFIEVLDVQFPQKQEVEVGPDGCAQADCLEAVLSDGKLTVTNPMHQPVLIQSLFLDEHEEPINVVVDGGESIELFPEQDFTHCRLQVRVVRELDMIIPRTRCLVRHRAERFQPSVLQDIIFDAGTLLRWGDRHMQKERMLRRRLEKSPYDALAAANLGYLLLQKREYDEARKWLHHALRLRESLPDNGRRAEMELRELERKVLRSGLRAPQAGSGPARVRVGANGDNRDHAERETRGSVMVNVQDKRQT